MTATGHGLAFDKWSAAYGKEFRKNCIREFPVGFDHIKFKDRIPVFSFIFSPYCAITSLYVIYQKEIRIGPSIKMAFVVNELEIAFMKKYSA